MVAVLNSSLLAGRASGMSLAGAETTPREANGNARIAADTGSARSGRAANDPITVRTLFETQRLASDDSVSPAAPGLDPFAIIDGARLAARSAENRQGMANAARAAALFEGALDGISAIETLLERLEQLAADASLADLDATDGDTPPMSLSDQDRARLNTEFATLRAQIDRLVDDTVIDGIAVLGGVSFAVAVGGEGLNGDSLTVGLASARVADLAAGFDTADITTLAGATAALAATQAALDTLGDIGAQARGALNRLGYAAGALDTAAGVTEAARTGRLTPAPALDTARDVAESLLAQRGITDPPAGLGIDLTLLQSFAGVAPPVADDTDQLFDIVGAAVPASAAPAPQPAAAPAPYTPAQTGRTLSVSV